MDGMSPVALTSRWVAAIRARETDRLDRLFDDPYAASLAGEAGFAMLSESQKVQPGAPSDDANPYVSIRTRFFDDALLRAVGDASVRQVVILAAGMDARSFRLAWPSGVTVYELDRDEVFDHKEAILRGMCAEPTCTRQVVRADLEHDWTAPLKQAGFDADRPAAFLAEGLTVYLTEASVAKLLTDSAHVAHAGTWLGIDLIGTELLTSPYMKAFLEMLERLGCPWRYGTPDPEPLLVRYGWTPTITLPGESGANFGRWPYPVAFRDMPGIPRSYLITGRRSVS
jgi:methyltransferase (TIGR00027 family)